MTKTHPQKFILLSCCAVLRSSRPDEFCEKGVLRNFAKFLRKHFCPSLFFNKVAGASLFNKVAGAAYNFIEKETLAQVFSCEFLRTHFLQNTSGGCFCLFIRTLFNIYQKYEIRTISKKLFLNIKFLLYKKHFFSSYIKNSVNAFLLRLIFIAHFWYCM